MRSWHHMFIIHFLCASDSRRQSLLQVHISETYIHCTYVTFESKMSASCDSRFKKHWPTSTVGFIFQVATGQQETIPTKNLTLVAYY